MHQREGELRLPLRYPALLAGKESELHAPTLAATELRTFSRVTPDGLTGSVQPGSTSRSSNATSSAATESRDPLDAVTSRAAIAPRYRTVSGKR